MTAKILDIFKSVQGEGKFAGAMQVFVRFFECNMHCVWCDTPASIGDTTRNYKEMTLEQVMGQIKKLWPGCQSVSLTGGEPLIQKDFISELLPLLKEAGMPTHLETNGILPEALKDVVDLVDVVAMDIKAPSSTKQKPYWSEQQAFLNIARQKDVFVKLVVSKDTLQQDIEKAVKVVCEVDSSIMFILQPNTYELKEGALERCLEFQSYCTKYLTDVRILPQIHKFLKIP